LRDGELRARLVAGGVRRAAETDVGQMAERTLRIYAALASG
jgi:hypothetical protein